MRENRSSVFSTKSDTNWAVQQHKMATNLKISDLGSRGIVQCIHVAKTKALISFMVTVKLICVFVFHMQKASFPMTRLSLLCGR